MKRRILYCVLLFFSWMVAVPGQTPANQSDTAPPQAAQETTATPAPGDPLGRGTPHGTLKGFLEAAQSGKYDEASQYLQLSKRERAAKGEAVVQQLHALLDQAFVGRIGAVSDNPEGSDQAGVPRNHERIGVFHLNGTETDVDLVRVSDPAAGDIWLFSSQTLAKVPKLAGQLEENEIESGLPRVLVQKQVLSTPLWRWIAFLLLIPLSFGLAWGLVRLLNAGRRVWLRRRRRPVTQDIYDSVAPPLTFILAVAFHWIGISFLGFSLLFREYYRQLAGLAIAVGVAWLVFRLINRWAEQSRLKALEGPGYRSAAIVLLGQRILKVVAAVVAVLAMLSILGVDITAAVAGLGIGSIAIAFAAQKTLENLLGGISILGDQVIRVGESCRIGDHEGTVEDISLRSTRIRTLEGSELSVPNGQLANASVENLSRRDTRLFHAIIKLRQETSPDQLRSLLEKMRTLISNHPKVDPNAARVRLVGFGDSSLDVEINCHFLTPDLNEFFAIREDLFLSIMDLIAEAGSALASPARTLRMPQDLGLKRMPAEEPSAFRLRRAG